MNALYLGGLIARQCHQFVTDMDLSRLDLSLETTECMVRTAYTLYRHIESFFGVILADIDVFQIWKQCLAGVPRNVPRGLCDIVTLCSGYRDDLHILQAQFCGQFLDLLLDLLKPLPVISHQIHFIDGKDEITDSHQITDPCMTAGLHQHALLGVDQDHGQVGKGCTYRHVSGIFLMTRCVGHDETSLVCREITVCHVDGDALFSLCHQSIQKQGVVDRSSAASHFTVKLQGFLLICI